MPPKSEAQRRAELRHVKKNVFYDKLTRRGNYRWTYVPKVSSRVIPNGKIKPWL
jgi:hypothetical protein